MAKVDTWRTIYFAFIPATALTVVRLYKVKPSLSWAKWDDRVGSISYPIYLDHYLAASLLTYFYPVRANEGSYQVLFVMALSIAIAILLVRFVDQPIERIRKRIKEGGSSHVLYGCRSVDSKLVFGDCSLDLACLFSCFALFCPRLLEPLVIFGHSSRRRNSVGSPV